MDTNTSNINSEDGIVRIRRQLLTEVNWINCRDVGERAMKYVLRKLNYFAIKSTRKDYHPLILMYMNTLLDIRKRCPNVQLKEMFDTILPELTEWCGIIAVNIGNAPFLLTFFSLWSEIMLNTDKIIQRFAGITKISALTNICETIFKIGHFQTQLNGLELLLRYIKACEEEERKKILEDIIPSQKFQRIRELLYDIDISNFELEGRKFLNEFNMIISDEEPVYSIAVEKGYIGAKPIIKPMYEDKVCVLWVDFNSETESISFSCQSTTFSRNTEKWINIEVKFPKEINIERRKCEFNFFANRDDIEVYPHPTPQMFLQPRILFRFIYIERDLSNLQKVISCYNSKKSLKPLTNQPGENSNQSLNRNKVYEIVRYSREMPNLSRVLNISFETKNPSDNRHKAKQGNNFEKQTILGDSAQNNSNEINSVGVRIKSEKYTSFDQVSCELDFQDDPKKHCLNNFEDDITDLDSFSSIESNDCIRIEDDTRNVGRKVEKTAKKNLTEVVNIKSPLKACAINDSSKKRKLLNPENKEIVPYKRVRTNSTTDFNSDGIGGDILSNLRRKFHKLFSTVVSDKRLNSDFEEIKENLIEKLSNFMTSCELHNLQSFESWKQIQKLLVQIGKEKEQFHLESLTAFNQLSRTEKVLVELKKIYKTKEAEKLDSFEKMCSDTKEAVTRAAKAKWEAYINNLTNNIIKNIQKHINFDIFEEYKF